MKMTSGPVPSTSTPNRSEAKPASGGVGATPDVAQAPANSAAVVAPARICLRFMWSSSLPGAEHKGGPRPRQRRDATSARAGGGQEDRQLLADAGRQGVGAPAVVGGAAVVRQIGVPDHLGQQPDVRLVGQLA